ncbi:MAG: hypothetical protein B6D68_02345, partial [spirochete symbiont of Stewartia floridana]
DTVLLENYKINDTMSVRTEEINQIARSLILRISGQIDFDNAWPFLDRVNSFIAKGYIMLILDCTDVNYISSSGIGALVSIEKELLSRNGTMVLVGLRQKVFDLFDLLGFRDHFDYNNTVEEAVGVYCENNYCLDDDEINKNSPLVFRCPICAKKQKAERSGRFRCSFCRFIVEIDEDGEVFARR